MSADPTQDRAAELIQALADRPGAPKSERKVASQMIYREHALAIVRGEPIDPRWFYGGKEPA